MDIWLVYIVKTLLLPVSSLLICSFIACFYVIKNKGKGGFFLVTPLLCLFLLSLPLVALFLAKIPYQYKALDYSEIGRLKPEAIVVLGGGSRSYAPEYAADLTVKAGTLVRLRYAAYLVNKIKLPILVSGGSVFKEGGVSEAELMASILTKEFKIPVKWLESKSRNTAENAQYTQLILAKQHINRVILITHAIHMNRAVKQFERVGLSVIPAPTDLLPSSKIDIFYFLPSVRALERSSMVIHEWMGHLWYALRYE